MTSISQVRHAAFAVQTTTFIRQSMSFRGLLMVVIRWHHREQLIKAHAKPPQHRLRKSPGGRRCPLTSMER